MLWEFFLFLLEFLDLAADLFYTAATITGILLARPSLASFYTRLYLLQFFFKLLEAHPWRPFCHNMHLQAINITDHLRKRICERINHLSLSYHAKKNALMWRLVNLKISKNLQYHRRRCFHKISSKSAILMLFIWHKFKTEGKNSGSSIIHPRWFLFPQKLLIYPPHTLL